ncbi:hypothetical protein RMATCC62417_09662 [Rhizopus microsporus]|nr:hypothetical protein RMATCC62417_09662 [Rhizopus microsporus]
MHTNLSKFGQVVDCGIVRDLTGLYTGRGYAVLDISQTNPVHALTRAVSWQYTPCRTDRMNPTTVEVYAIWNSMGPYCRYCHSSEHALVGCEKKNRIFSVTTATLWATWRDNDLTPIQAPLTSVVIPAESSIHLPSEPDLINVISLETSSGAITEEITHSLATSSTPVVEETSFSLASSPSRIRTSAVSKYATAPYTSTRSHSTVSSHPRESTTKTSSPRATCSSCGAEGHQRKTSKQYPHYTAPSKKGTTSSVPARPAVSAINEPSEDIDMDGSTDESHELLPASPNIFMGDVVFDHV